MNISRYRYEYISMYLYIKLYAPPPQKKSSKGAGEWWRQVSGGEMEGPGRREPRRFGNRRVTRIILYSGDKHLPRRLTGAGPCRGFMGIQLNQPQSLPSTGSLSDGEAVRTNSGESRPRGIGVEAEISKGPGEPRGGSANSAWGVAECFLKEVVFKPGSR